MWSASYLAFIRPLRPENVLRVGGGCQGCTPESRAEWYAISAAQRLAEHHGEARAVEILSGRDRTTENDLAAWYALGRRTAA